MDITGSVFISVVDYLKHAALAGLGARLRSGRYVDELETDWLPGGRSGSESPIKVEVTLQGQGHGFLPGDRARVAVRDGYRINVSGPINLDTVSPEEFHAWLGEVKAAAELWS